MSAPRKSAFDTLASVRVVPSMWQAADRLTSVPGLLAKPIVDVAVGVRRDADPEAVRRRLVALGWVYRGDAGDAGGHVFILERGPGIRIAHLHVVEHDGSRYLALRDRLQRDPAARSAYEQAKRALIDGRGTDNSKRAYTSGKAAILRELLDGTPPVTS